MSLEKTITYFKGVAPITVKVVVAKRDCDVVD